MFSLRLLRALVVLLCLQANALAQSEPSHLSTDPRVQQARALIEDRRFDPALSILRPLAPDHPDRTDVLFLIGLAAIEASQQSQIPQGRNTVLLDEAIAALRTILIDRPELVRVRLELARAFFFKGQDNLARQHFRRVLAGRPPSAIAANVQRFLNVMQARRRWRHHFGFSLAPDSNLNSASEENTIFINGLPFQRDADATARSGTGIILWGGSEYQYPFSPKLALRLGTDIAWREYANDTFDQTFLSLHIGPRWRKSPATEFSALISGRHRSVAGETESRDLGLRLESEYRISPRLSTFGRVAWHRRTYSRSDHLNGPQWSLILGGAWWPTPTIQTSALIGYARERPQTLVWRNNSQRIRLGSSFTLPRGYTIGISGEWLWTRYQGDWFPFTSGDPREDRTRILQVSALNRGYTIYGFSPQLVLVNEARQSNAQLYDYRRNRAELRFMRQF